MTTLLIRNARCIATFDDARTELRDASILVHEVVLTDVIEKGLKDTGL